MKVVLLGATGFVGSALLNEALSRRHNVTAVARDVGKLPRRDRLVAKSCDLSDTTALADLLRGHDAVISAFNPGWKNFHLYGDQVKGTGSILRARHGSRKTQHPDAGPLVSLLYMLGAVDDAEKLRFEYEGIENASISMRYLSLGAT
ncbi:MAG TPA: NAD(P)H-binding protein [Bryobacteraceae bacterium]|nr:NAD(P)H-binding protein [Bryobacteraceae bacterium]